MGSRVPTQKRCHSPSVNVVKGHLGSYGLVYQGWGQREGMCLKPRPYQSWGAQVFKFNNPSHLQAGKLGPENWETCLGSHRVRGSRG